MATRNNLQTKRYKPQGYKGHFKNSPKWGGGGHRGQRKETKLTFFKLFAP